MRNPWRRRLRGRGGASRSICIDGILRADLDVPRKQRHTVKRIYDRLSAEHDMLDVSYAVVRATSVLVIVMGRYQGPGSPGPCLVRSPVSWC
ncbi:hypothetical protein C1I99_10975 [Micromonospora deserti]|uniref:Uncharacterized protein n=1 Tax=Micromonospora deserti TaxID=2070366 RepID=A0A2W2DIZ4_9ACTN|nr:hypothetical protein C1I99_10975 [Micromonospora deserti]